MTWSAPPEPVTWVFPTPLTLGTASYPAITLRAPTGADILKATALAGEPGYTVTLRLIANISVEQVPFEALLTAPAWMIDQMSRYFDAFNGAPMPGPLEGWAHPPAAPDTASPPASASPPTP